MNDLGKSLAALVLVSSLGACGQNDAGSGAGDAASQTLKEQPVAAPSGIMGEAVDAAGDLVDDAVGGDVTSAVQDAAGNAMEQARELGDDAVTQARDMAADAVDEVKEDPQAAAKALTERF